MKRLVSKKDRKFYTYMLEILQVLDIQLDYKWLITGVEAYPSNLDANNKINNSNNSLIISNSELINMLKEEDFQWIWGTFSLFENNITDEQIRNFNMPDLYDCPEFYIDNPKIQHPLSILEINAFDSSYVFMITDIYEYLERFKKIFPLSKENF